MAGHRLSEIKDVQLRRTPNAVFARARVPHSQNSHTRTNTNTTSNKTKPLLNANSVKKRDMNEMTMDEGTQAHAVR